MAPEGKSNGIACGAPAPHPSRAQSHDSGAVQLILPIQARASPIGGTCGEEAPEVVLESCPTAPMWAKVAQSPSERYFNPSSPCQSPLIASHGLPIAARPPLHQDVCSQNCHSPLAASYSSTVEVGPRPPQNTSSQNCFFTVYPCFEPPQQMYTTFACPADIAANSVAHVPGMVPCFAAAPLAATEPSMMASSATMPSTLSVITAPTAGVWESGQRHEPPPQPQLPDGEMPRNQRECPAAVFIDLSCLKEKGHSSAEKRVPLARQDPGTAMSTGKWR